ncbi:hypothetical protein H1C71_031757 [Ictidomys tridecemlineatus]|uniref:proteasome activator complex subunit 3-like n=1 Tax=Ictidomys tridecemlineatus TaxID=43179 RepID=UPI001A9D997F|nr:proteasome activator complex subunit 3-like [Ictidomys tridecemlineatus]KAG3281141.1 hypothetical protein H1C71_031757 [Ictidomys tridecemlineatus]
MSVLGDFAGPATLPRLPKAPSQVGLARAPDSGRHFRFGLLGVGDRGRGQVQPAKVVSAQYWTPLEAMASPLKLEQDVQGKVDSFRARIAQEAEDLVSTFFPQKLSELDSRVQELRLQDLSRIRSVPAPEPPATPDTAGDGPNRDPLPLQTQSSVKVPGGEGRLLRSNQHLVELIERVKPEIELLREKCNTVRMWVQLLIPKVEDGNNFGVSIQEDTVDQLWTVESTAASYLRRFSTYYNTRAKLVSKIVKYPQVEDYRRTVAEVDENEYLSVRQILLHVRNQYATLHDVILKNIEKIKTPRSTNTDNLY